MRRVSEVAFLVVLVACTPGGSDSQPVQAPITDEAAPTNEAPAAVAAAPPDADQQESKAPARPPVDPSTQPRLEVVSRKLDAHQREMGLCPYEVLHHAFPAISDDGATLVAAQAIEMDRVSGDEFIELTWLGADETRVEAIFNHGQAEKWPEHNTKCNVVSERLREKVDALNTELAAHTWRPLERLDVLFSKAGIKAMYELPGGGVYASIDEVLEGLPGRDRPVEVYYHAEHFMARVRDLKVLQKTPRPQWRHSQYNNEFCGEQVLVSGIEFDRATGLAVVSYNFDSEGGCLCNDPGSFGRIELSAELLAEAELRSTEKFMAAYARVAQDAEEGI